MNDYLGDLLATSFGTADSLAPRVPAAFEPVPADEVEGGPASTAGGDPAAPRPGRGAPEDATGLATIVEPGVGPATARRDDPAVPRRGPAERMVPQDEAASASAPGEGTRPPAPRGRPPAPFTAAARETRGAAHAIRGGPQPGTARSRPELEGARGARPPAAASPGPTVPLGAAPPAQGVPTTAVAPLAGGPLSHPVGGYTRQSLAADAARRPGDAPPPAIVPIAAAPAAPPPATPPAPVGPPGWAGPTVRVHIDRIEVRAATPPPRRGQEPPRPVPRAPRLSLQDYLRRRDEAGR